MGLNETIGDDLVATSESNNIDVHMMKATEYGAMAILSASGFGYSGKLQDAPVKSTTGNATGVYIAVDRWEWVAGVCDVKETVGEGKDPRYYDLYKASDQTSAKVGDALGNTYGSNPGCLNWHTTNASAWVTWVQPGFCRGYDGIFRFWGDYYKREDFAKCGRGVAVVKPGI